MLKIYDVDTARRTILRRDSQADARYPAGLIAAVEGVFGAGATPERAVAEIVQSVRVDGDVALREWSRRIEAVALDDLAVPRERLAEAFESLPVALRDALTCAAKRIREYHRRQLVTSWVTDEMGGYLGQRVTALRRVGLYVPGGSAPLPSSLLMSAIPAQVAGVEEIVVCSPPQVHQSILAAAHLCGVSRVFAIGGAQAIAALAYGTQSVPRVDKIAGAGNVFVTLAKKQVFGDVGLDGLAGPTETMLIADSSANAKWVAADLLAQAEHDVLASAILLTDDRELAEAVRLEVARQIESLPRAEIIAQSLEIRGGVVLVPNVDVAIELANDYAPEHLCLSLIDAEQRAQQVRNAGGVFIGERSFEVLGDYVAGPSHVMPTGGTARFASPLNVLDFVKITSVVALDAVTCAELSPLAAEIARAEGLMGHAAAAGLRREAGD